VALLSSLSGIKMNPLIGISPLVASGLTGWLNVQFVVD